MQLGKIGSRSLWLALVLALSGVGCASETVPPDVGGDDFPLSDHDSLYEDTPADNGRGLPADNKFDETLPATFDLMELATPVRSQGRRGTCTIFATTALMESLYVREGTITEPDFSEQFLQWSSKVELGAFRNTEGSNPNENLRAISQHGIVQETVWPYESEAWGTSNDEMCTGDNRPTRCYTNGDPTEEMLMAQRFSLPRGRWINPSPNSIKGHMISTRTPVVVSGTFFYQAWNHGRSNLTTSSEYQANGYVLSPNEADIEDSSGERRAGHGFELIGWDDNLEVARVDGEGQPLVDADGNPLMERGFFLFKNSWGTGRFGVNNPHGAGFGWIAYRYVQEYLTAYVAGLPDVVVPEVCNDGRDNDRNGAADCDDAACAADAACMDPGDQLTNTTSVPIPDNDPAGASTTITVTEGGPISSMSVTVDITHTWRGDLEVRLVREEDGAQAVLWDQSGGSEDDLVETFDVSAFNNTDAAGTYRLVVVDHAGQDVGTLNQWRMELTRCMSDCDRTPTPQTFTDEGGAIPDNASLGRSISIGGGPNSGEIVSMSVSVDIDHEAPIDLTVRFGREGGREFVLLTMDLTDESHVERTFDVPGFTGESLEGQWTLTVVDGAAGDTGTLNSWSITATTR